MQGKGPSGSKRRLGTGCVPADLASATRTAAAQALLPLRAGQPLRPLPLRPRTRAAKWPPSTSRAEEDSMCSRWGNDVQTGAAPMAAAPAEEGLPGALFTWCFGYTDGDCVTVVS